MITCISFDMDDTLISEEIDKVIWNEEIPQLYAKHHNISLEAAKEKVYAEYYRALYIEKVKDWTDIDYWFKRFSLTNWQMFLEDMRKRISVYDDTVEVLSSLKKEHTLIVISRAERKFLDMKLEAAGLKHYFTHTFSTASDFHDTHKSTEVFKQVMKIMNLQAEQIMHIGDNQLYDYETPKSIGIKALLLDRSRTHKGNHIINSLREIKERL